MTCNYLLVATRYFYFNVPDFLLPNCGNSLLVLVRKISFCQADFEFAMIQQFTYKSDRTPTLSNLLPVDDINISHCEKGQG